MESSINHAKVPFNKLKAVPMQCINIPGAVILKRGCTEFKISGEGVAEAVQVILEATTGEGATENEIYELFGPQSQPTVAKLLAQLIERRLLIDGSIVGGAIRTENSLDIFYWDCRERSSDVIGALNQREIAICGVNYISRQLTSAFQASGTYNFKVFDHPFLRNLSFFESGKLNVDKWPSLLRAPEDPGKDLDLKGIDCVIATSDFGRSPVMNELNRLCMASGRHFLPVILKNVIGYVGPLVLPGETACFECLEARQNSHFKDLEAGSAVDAAAFESQSVVGFHPSMASVLGDIAALELTKFYSGVIPSANIGTLIEVNLLRPRVIARKVLKVPRCLACSSLKAQASTTPDKTIFVPLDK